MIRLVIGALILAFAVEAAPAGAQDWPRKPIRILVGIAPGGLPDTVGRLIATQLTKSLGQPVVVENRPGAGGNIAASIVAKAPADGHMLLVTGNNHAVNPTLIPDPGFDYERDLAPVTMLAEANMVLVATPSLTANSIAELVALAKPKPGSITIAISPIGSPNHLGAELLAQMAGVELTFIPYGGIGQATPDLLAGRVQLAIAALPSVRPNVESGAMKALAVTRPTRSQFAPSIPTAAESGLPGFDVNAWVCLMATGGTPAPIISKLNDAVRKAMALPEVRGALTKQGTEPTTGSPDQLGAYIKAEAAKWAGVLKNAKVK